jgi:hypothetical protein
MVRSGHAQNRSWPGQIMVKSGHWQLMVSSFEIMNSFLPDHVQVMFIS